MRFTVSAALLAFAAKVLAQTADFDPILTPGEDETLDAGSKYKITWEVVDKYNGTATIALLGGKTENTLDIIDTIASDVDNSAGSYEWSIGSDLGSDPTYGLKISWNKDDSIFQYSFPFAIKGSGSSSSSSASGSATASSTSASASASGTSGSSTTGSASGTVTSTVTSVSSTVSPIGNLSTTGSPATTVTSVVVPTGSTTGSSPSTTASTVPANSAAKLAGSFIALTGLAAAALLL